MKIVIFLAYVLPCLIGNQGYVNIALRKRAVQSSNYVTVENVSAALAVDGNTNQTLAGGSCARTNLEAKVWWIVDLGSIKSIYSIKVYYRNDSDGNVQTRVLNHAGFSLYVANSTGPKEGHLCYKNKDALPPLLSEHVCIQHGRYVTYYNERGPGVIVPQGSKSGGSTIAELCEVQVFETTSDNNSHVAIVIGVCATVVLIIIIVIIFVTWRISLLQKGGKDSLGLMIFSALKKTSVEDDELTEPDDFSYKNTILELENETDETEVYESISISELHRIITAKSEDDNASFKKEYMALPKGETSPCDEAKKPDNVQRNRYKTTFPYDHSRVILQCNSQKESDYINANYLENVDGERVYIATQGPKITTTPDFWRMVWQENTSKIVNLTNIKEGSKIKCDKYWPDRNQSCKRGNIKIRNVEETVYANYIVRKFTITCKASTDMRVVYMFHYTAWPDHDVPEALNLTLFHRHVIRMAQAQNKSPIIVHCSAGIGRTGTFIAIDSLYSHGTKSGKVNVPEYVRSMRKSRMNMIQSHEQYKMVYETLNEAFRAKHNLVYRDKFVEKYGDLKNDASQSTTELEIELKTLKEIKPIYSESDFTTAKENLDKNFSPDILPVDRYLCHLSYVKGQSNYYNAVLLQSYTRPDAFISAQFPAAGSTESLFRLMKDFEAHIIVALTPITDLESVYTNSFLPQAQSSITVGSFILTHKSTSKTTSVSKTNLVLRKKGSKDVHLAVFECIPWQTTDWKSDPGVVVDLVKEIKMSQYVRPNTSIVVLSSDGVSRCGMFCTVFNALEQLTTDHEVDIFTIARQLQIRRPEFFQDFMEYKFCYEVVSEYLRNDMVYVNC